MDSDEVDGEQHIESCCVKHGCQYGSNSMCPVSIGIVMQLNNPCEISEGLVLCRIIDKELTKIAAIKVLRAAADKMQTKYVTYSHSWEWSTNVMPLVLAKELIDALEKAGMVLVQKNIPTPPSEYISLTEEQWDAITGQSDKPFTPEPWNVLTDELF